jgi:thioredoxin-related protein
LKWKASLALLVLFLVLFFFAIAKLQKEKSNLKLKEDRRKERRNQRICKFAHYFRGRKKI